MGKLNSLESLSTIAWKSIDKMDDEEKKEALINILEKMDDLGASKRLNKAWGPLSEEEKIDIYNDWNVWDLRVGLKDLNVSPQNIIKQFTSLKENWVKSSFKCALLKRIAPACRFCVQLWILDKPDWLNEKQLKKDIKKDARHIKNNLTALDLASRLIPELKPIQPYIKEIMPFVKWYKKHWTEVLISRLNKKNRYTGIESAKKNGQKDIADTLKNRNISTAA